MSATNERSWTLVKQPATDWPTFIQFWSNLYDYSSTNPSYNAFVIERGPKPHVFDPEDIRQLFKWKNNTQDNLSAKKAISVENIILKIDAINELSMSWNDVNFLSNFGKISTVWQVYLMHIIQPSLFPIFDQTYTAPIHI